MEKPDFYLAQVNIARMKKPLTDPLMAGFVARQDELNALAEASEGFIWRLKPDPDSEQQLVACEKDGTLVNLSVWVSLETLKKYVYESAHREVLKARSQWFDPPEVPHLALWWIPNDHTPGVDEALLRLDRLEMIGPAQNAFDFSKSFPPPQARRRPKKNEEE